MKLGIKKYFIFARSGMQTVIAYRGAVLLWFVGGIINSVLLGLVWWAIFKFSDGDTIGGYTLPQMLMYVFLSAVVGEVSFSQTMGRISDDVKDGAIGMQLIKPVSYRAQLGFTTVGSFAARLLIVGVPMTLVGTLVLVFGFGLEGILWYNVLLFVPACFLSVMVIDAFEFIFGQLAFRTQAMFGVNSMMNTLMSFLSGAMVPLSLFPVWAQSALEYTPFPTISSMPVKLFLGQLSLTETLTAFGLSLAWVIVLNLIGSLLYKTSVRKVVVFGG